MLLARRRLDRGDELPRDAQLGERAEARLASGIVVADRLEQADHAFLDDVVAIRAGQEVRTRLAPNEAAVAMDEQGACLLISGLCRADQR